MKKLDLSICAPILIPTYCRSEHFIRMIESLKKNTLAKHTDIYVGVDFPLKKEHEKGNFEILEYLKGDFSAFKSLTVIRHSQNVGSSNNVISLRNLVEDKYPYFITTDDDLEFAPLFLEFVNTALQYYKNDERVIAISGYCAPVNYIVSEGATCMKQQIQYHAWGTALFSDKAKKIRKYFADCGLARDFDLSLKNGTFNKLAEAAKLTYIHDALSDSKNTFITRPSDEAYRILQSIKDLYSVIPVKSLVRNHGFDGSGLTCPKTHQKKGDCSYHYEEQPIDESLTLNFVPDTLNEFKQNKKLYNKFDKRKMFKVRLKLFIYKLLGRKLFFKLRKKFKKV